MTVHLFNLGNFVLHSGAASAFKIDADALTDADWEALAALAVKRLPPFGAVEGVPTGGLPFARALAKYATGEPGQPILVADDVLTTGRSMEELRFHHDTIGVVAFARGPCPSWVTPLFTLSPEREP